MKETKTSNVLKFSFSVLKTTHFSHQRSTVKLSRRNFMNGYGYLFNLAGYPARYLGIFRIRYLAGNPAS
jgi:hypothetical protein